MSWKKIKTFLIILFAIINVYLLFSSSDMFQLGSYTVIDDKAISDAADIIRTNYGIELDKSLVPDKITNLNNIDVDNIIYTDKFNSSEYDFSVDGVSFSSDIATDTYSYTETSAEKELGKILSDIGIPDNSYVIKTSKNDSGLTCIVTEKIKEYPIFNGRISASFTSAEITLAGTWYITGTAEVESDDKSMRMADITGVIVNMASESAGNHADVPDRITSIDYGYFVSSYAENTVNKSASAIPCYVIGADNGSKYYYDAANGNLLKQED